MFLLLRCPLSVGRTVADTVLRLYQIIHMSHSQVKFVDDVCTSKVKVTVTFSRKNLTGRLSPLILGLEMSDLFDNVHINNMHISSIDTLLTRLTHFRVKRGFMQFLIWFILFVVGRF